MNKDPFDVMFPYWGGEVKGKPGGWAVGYNVKLWETNWALRQLRGKKRPWRVQKFKRSLYTGEVQLLGRPICFKTKASAKKAILEMAKARKKIWEEKCGSSSGEGRVTSAQRELANARSKTRRKWFPDTTAVLEQMEQTGRTEEHDLALRKALAIDLARLKRTPDPEITSSISLDQKFTASLEKAWSSANPLDPVDEEIVLNWVALYSEDKPNDYGDKIREKTGSKIYDAAIKRRVYRKGLRVAEKFQKPKPKPQ